MHTVTEDRTSKNAFPFDGRTSVQRSPLSVRHVTFATRSPGRCGSALDETHGPDWPPTDYVPQ